MHPLVFRLLSWLVAVFLASGLSGCWGPRRHDVTGQVKVNGTPLDSSRGTIVFVGPKGVQVPASINADGTYRAVGVVAGLNRVAVYYLNPEYQPPRRKHTKPKEGEEAPAASASSPFLTPLKYASVDTSGLSVEVKAGTVFDVNLTDSGKP